MWSEGAPNRQDQWVPFFHHQVFRSGFGVDAEQRAGSAREGFDVGGESGNAPGGAGAQDSLELNQKPVGASLLAMLVNDDAQILNERGVLAFIASKLAPTGTAGCGPVERCYPSRNT